jgi:hypothetical protein
MMIINVHITVKTGGAVAVGSSALLGHKIIVTQIQHPVIASGFVFL